MINGSDTVRFAVAEQPDLLLVEYQFPMLTSTGDPGLAAARHGSRGRSSVLRDLVLAEERAR